MIKRFTSLMGCLLLATTPGITAEAFSERQLNTVGTELAKGLLPLACKGGRSISMKNLDETMMLKAFITADINPMDMPDLTDDQAGYFVTAMIVELSDGMSRSCPRVDRVNAIYGLLESFSN